MTHHDHHDRPHRSLGYHTDLALRRNEGSLITHEAGVTIVRSPQNPTFWWGNFILMPEPPQAGDELRWPEVFRAAHPNAQHCTIGIDTTDGCGEQLEGFQAQGFKVLQDTVLTCQETHLPRTVNRDAHLRPLDPQQQADWDAALTLRMAVNAAEPHGHAPDDYREFSKQKLASYRLAQQQGKGAMFGAFNDHAQMLSGLGIFDAGNGIARYQSVETHPQARSRGLAGTLVHTAAQWAKEHLNTHTLVIVADPDYHAQSLYQSVGFQPTEIQLALERGGYG